MKFRFNLEVILIWIINSRVSRISSVPLLQRAALELFVTITALKAPYNAFVLTNINARIHTQTDRDARVSSRRSECNLAQLA